MRQSLVGPALPIGWEDGLGGGGAALFSVHSHLPARDGRPDATLWRQEGEVPFHDSAREARQVPSLHALDPYALLQVIKTFVTMATMTIMGFTKCPFIL